MQNSSVKQHLATVTSALNDLEGMRGPCSHNEYLAVMKALAEDIQERIKNAVEQAKADNQPILLPISKEEFLAAKDELSFMEAKQKKLKKKCAARQHAKDPSANHLQKLLKKNKTTISEQAEKIKELKKAHWANKKVG